MPGHVEVLGGFGPRIHVDDRGVPAELVDRLDAVAVRAWDGPVPVGPRARDSSGDWAEVDVDAFPALAEARLLVEAAAGMHADRVVCRARRYPTGKGHPPHSDVWSEDGHRLVATGLVYLNDAEGGETRFPRAAPEPLTFACRRGRLVVWWSVDADGATDPTADHESLPVLNGEKRVFAFFLYRRVAAAGAAVDVRDTGTGLTLLAAPGRAELTRALVAAALARDIDVRVVDPSEIALGLDPRPLDPGEALYNLEADPRSLRVEQLLTGPGVRTTWSDPEGAHFPYRSGPLLLQRHGVPIPRTCFAPPRTVDGMERLVDQLGGFPVVVKALGGSGGVGVLRVDSVPGLASILDLLTAEGREPLVCECIADAETWRVFVVGDRAVGAYRNPAGPDGFRSRASEDPGDYLHALPTELAAVSVAACRALRTRFGGVDVMIRGAQPYVLEVNNPAWFGHAQEHGIDVAGALVDLLCGGGEGLAPGGLGASRPGS